MIPRRVYTALGIIAYPLDKYRTHTMILKGVYTPLRIHGWDERPSTGARAGTGTECCGSGGTQWLRRGLVAQR